MLSGYDSQFMIDSLAGAVKSAYVQKTGVDPIANQRAVCRKRTIITDGSPDAISFPLSSRNFEAAHRKRFNRGVWMVESVLQ